VGVRASSKLVEWGLEMKLHGLMGVAAAAAMLVSFGAPAHAAKILPATTPSCADTDVSPTASACAGFVAGNQTGGSPAMVLIQQNELASLGFTWDGSTYAAGGADNQGSLGGATTVNFAVPLDGVTFIGIHFGKGSNPGFNEGGDTAWYKFDFAGPTSSINLNLNSSSGIVVYSTSPVPEPATWGTMLLGFGALGAMMRRSRRLAVA
jgi:hypothetical protein